MSAARQFADEAHAPVLFFEDAPAFSNANGIVTIAIGVGRAIPLVDNGADTAPAIVAYLKCTPMSAMALRTAINSALLLGAETKGAS